MQVRLLFWSLRHRKWRQALNAVAMAITAAVFMLFISIVLELKQFSREGAKGGLSRIVVAPKIVAPGSTIDGMPMSFFQTFAAIDGVKFVQRRFVVNGKHPSGATYLVFGEEDSGIELNPDIYPVTPEVIDAWKKDKSIAAIVSEATARDLRLKVGDTTEVPTSFGSLKIKVLAITHNSLVKQSIGIHFDYMQQLTKVTETCGYRVFTEPQDFDRVTKEINERTKNSAMPTQAISSSRWRQTGMKQAAAIPTVLGFLGVFLILTTGLTLANNSAISIRERRTEAATLRVLGFYRSTIGSLFVSEAVIVGLVGGLLSIAGMYFAFKGGVKIGAAGTAAPVGLLQSVKIGWIAMVGGGILSMLVPLAGAIPAAVVAVRVPLAEGLRDAA